MNTLTEHLVYRAIEGRARWIGKAGEWDFEAPPGVEDAIRRSITLKIAEAITDPTIFSEVSDDISTCRHHIEGRLYFLTREDIKEITKTLSAYIKAHTATPVELIKTVEGML